MNQQPETKPLGWDGAYFVVGAGVVLFWSIICLGVGLIIRAL